MDYLRQPPLTESPIEATKRLILSGKIEQLGQLIQNNPDIVTDTLDETGETALILACKEGLDCVKIASMLLDSGAPVDHTDVSKKTALIHVSSRNFQDAVLVQELLLNHGATVNHVDKDGHTALQVACKEGLEGNVANLLKVKRINVNSFNRFGVTSLHQAAKNGNLNVVQLLLQNGADPNATDRWQNSALVYACLHGHCLVTSELIRWGSDVNIVNVGKKMALHTAVTKGRVDIVKQLIEAKAHLDIVDAEGNTPLLLASRGLRRFEGVATMLLDAGANPHKIDNHQRTILHYAAIRGCHDVVIQLLKLGVPPDIPDYNGNTALVFAVRRNFISIVKLLLFLNCSIHRWCHIARRRQTLLDVVFTFGYAEILGLLYKAGANRNVGWNRNMIRLNDDCIDILVKYYNQPRTLKDSCRILIRQYLSTNIHYEVKALPIPNMLKNYICMKELFDFSEALGIS